MDDIPATKSDLTSETQAPIEVEEIEDIGEVSVEPTLEADKKSKILFIIGLIGLLCIMYFFIRPIFNNLLINLNSDRTSNWTRLSAAIDTTDTPDAIDAIDTPESTQDSSNTQGAPNGSVETSNKSVVSAKYQKVEAQIGGEKFEIEIADTNESRTLGLSNRDSLAKRKGLLFVFDQDGIYQFWMKDLNFDIDIIWLDNEKRIVHMEQSVSPSTYPELFRSSVPARYVLELISGTALRLKIKNGDVIDFK